MNPKMYWSTEMEALLIDLIAEKPHLWDPRDKNYIRKSLRNESFQEIGAVLKEKWPDHAQLFTHGIMANKFAMLKSCFRREWKTAQRIRSSMGAEDFVPKWEHYARLSFLEKIPLRSSRNRIATFSPMDISDYSEESISSDEVTSTDAELDSGEYPGASSPESKLNPVLYLTPLEESHTKFRHYQSSDESSNEASTSITNQYFKDIYQENAGEVRMSPADIKRKNALDLAFCRYLNTMLSPIPDCLQKELAKIKITETILKLKFPQA